MWQCEGCGRKEGCGSVRGVAGRRGVAVIRGVAEVTGSVNELESAVANVATSVLDRAWQERYDGEESCVLIPIPTSLQTWCTGPPSDHLCVRAQQNSEYRHRPPEEI